MYKTVIYLVTGSEWVLYHLSAPPIPSFQFHVPYVRRIVCHIIHVFDFDLVYNGADGKRKRCHGYFYGIFHILFRSCNGFGASGNMLWVTQPHSTILAKQFTLDFSFPLYWCITMCACIHLPAIASLTPPLRHACNTKRLMCDILCWSHTATTSTNANNTTLKLPSRN